MLLAEVRVGQRVRWTTEGVSRTGQASLVDRRTSLIAVDYFSSLHRGWVRRQRFRPEQLEAVTEEV